MKITLSCGGGISRSFYLASQLDRRELLHKFYSPFYSQKFPFLSRILRRPQDKPKIDLNKVVIDVKIPLIDKFIEKTFIGALLDLDKRFILGEMFDKFVSRQIDNLSDIVIAESNLSLHTFRKAKELGLTTILDRTNSHIEYQTNLLKEEYLKLGLNFDFNSENVVRKGIEEYKVADYICVLSSFVKRTFLERNIPEGKLFLIPSGVDLTLFRKVDKEDKVFRIIYCGLSCVKKGLHYLLEAFHDLKLKNSELWLIGGISKEIKPFFKKYEGNYKALGYIQPHDLYKYYSQGSVFVLPSLEEGMAKVIMEAMACGLPVIATVNSGAEDILRDNIDGFVIPIRDKEAIKEKISFLYKNQNVCLEMGRNAQERIKHGFAWDDYGNRMISALKIVKQNKMVS